jgi:hypothetical protein
MSAMNHMAIDPFYWVYFSNRFWFLQDSALLSEENWRFDGLEIACHFITNYISSLSPDLRNTTVFV